MHRLAKLSLNNRSVVALSTAIIAIFGFISLGSLKQELIPSFETPQAAVVTTWGIDAEKELKKIPFFVRGKAKRNTEKYAADRGVHQISVDTLYEAKAHYAR